MFDFKTIAVAAITALVVTFGADLLVGDNQDFGGGTRFPNGISADTTSPNAGEVRGTTLTTSGNIAVSGEANQIGSANESNNVIFFGAGDGCAALQASASGTLTATPTSTSLCNS